MNIIQFLEVLRSKEFQQKFHPSLQGRDQKAIRYKDENDQTFCPITAVCMFQAHRVFDLGDYVLASHRIGLSGPYLRMIKEASDTSGADRNTIALRLRFKRIIRDHLNNFLTA